MFAVHPDFSRTLWRVFLGVLIVVLFFSTLVPAQASAPVPTRDESAPAQEQEIEGQDEEGSSYPVYRQTSAFLAGKVAVGVVAIESSTSSIPNQENWTSDELEKVRDEVWVGLQKWVAWKPANTPLEFVVDITQDGLADDMTSDSISPVEIDDEPIAYASGTYDIWTRAAMEAMGYTDGVTVQDAAYQYANVLRTNNNADWAFVLFVVDSSNDNDTTPGAFTDGQYMITRTFDPLAVMTYNNGMRGADNMEWTVAQIVARVFGAGFQYPDPLFDTVGCGSATKKFGYLGVANSYCGVALPGGEPNSRLMYHGNGDPDSITKLQVGWRDTDNDGIIDLMDTRPLLLFSPYPFNPTTNNPLTYTESGTRKYRAYEMPVSPSVCLNRPNDECFYSYYHDVTPDNLAVTINRITSVEYRVDGGGWNGATLTGSDPDYKIYSFTTSTLTGGKRKIEVRAQNSVGEYSFIASEIVIVAVAPENDLFVNRITIPSLPYNHAVDTTSATPTAANYLTDTDPIPVSSSCQNTRRGLHSVWYSYEAVSNDVIYADTFNTDYTTVLSVWKSGTSGLQLVACDDGSDGNPVQVQFTPEAGTTYYFMISQYNNLLSGSSEDVGGQSGGTLVFRVYNAIDIDVTIGGVLQGSYKLGYGEERRLFYPVSGGPVKVESQDGDKIVSAIRLQSFANNTLYSFVETMGVPQGLLSHKYVFPTYNNTWAPLNSQIRFGNLETTTTRIRVTIGGVNVWEDDVPGLEERRLYFNVSGGPVVVESLDTSKKIVAAIRLQSYANNILYSFSETMGIPAQYLSHKYYFPTYNNTWAPLNSQIRFGNLETTTTRIRVTIGGTVVWEEDVPGLQERRLTFPVSGGPVVVESLDTSKKIVAAIRLQSYANDTLYSFVETMGVSEGLLSHKYYFPTYNNTWMPLNSQIRFGNLSSQPVRVRITIGSAIVWEQDVPGLQERRLTFPISGGPVVVESLDPNKKIVAAIRLQSFANNILYSFSETIGIPEEQMSDTFYFPTYNNTWAPLNSQLRFGVP